MRGILLSAALLICVFISGAVNAQVPVPPPRDGETALPIGSGSISGVVITPEGTRIARAMVSVVSERGVTKAVPTDANGAFSLTQIAGGTYELFATMPTFLAAYYGQTKPGRTGTPLRLAEGQTLRDVKLTLVRGGVIAGTVFDVNGQPAWGALVRVLRRTWAPIGPSYRAGNESQRVDDRGQYRIAGLLPGEYVVLADPQSAPPYQSSADRLVSTMFPGATIADLATPVTIGPAEERGGVDIRLQVAPHVSVRGRVTGGRGASSVWITPIDSALESAVSVKATDAQGRFELSNLVPGRYKLGASDVSPTIGSAGIASPPSGSAPDRQWASAEIAVGPDGISDFTLALAPGGSLQGRFVFETSSTTAPNARLRTVRLYPVPGSIALPYVLDLAETPDASGRFTFPSIPAGKYYIDFAKPSGWYAKSAMSERQDLFDTLLEVAGGAHEVVITLTDRPTEIAGTLQGAPRSPGAYTVIAFAADARFWGPATRRVVAATPADGGFLFKGLPPGDYLLAVLEDTENGVWFDPRVLESLRPKAERVTLTDGQRLVKDLIVK